VPPLDVPPLDVPPLELVGVPEQPPLVVHVWPALQLSSSCPALAQHTLPIGAQCELPHCAVPLGHPLPFVFWFPPDDEPPSLAAAHV
jgi:hypothetical protein